MLRSLCFLLLLGCSLGHGVEDMIQHYGERKIYDSCFGIEQFHMKMEEFYRFQKECKNDQGIMSSPSASSPLVESGASPQLLDFQQLFRTQYGYSPQIFLLQLPQSIDQVNSRTKRQALFTTKKIRGLEDKAKKHIDMAICVFRKYKLLNSYNEVTWNEFEKKYLDLDVEPQLKEDLREGFTKCKNFAMCMTTDEKSSDHFPLGLKQAIAFFKCERKTRIAACCKKDLRKKPEMFELAGLDGFLANYDDDEKMLKILMMQAKFGDNFDALFE